MKYNNAPSHWSDSAKYPRVKIDNKLKFAEHFKKITGTANGVKFTLYPLINQQSPFSLKMKKAVHLQGLLIDLHTRFLPGFGIYQKNSWIISTRTQFTTFTLITGNQYVRFKRNR